MIGKPYVPPVIEDIPERTYRIVLDLTVAPRIQDYDADYVAQIVRATFAQDCFGTAKVIAIQKVGAEA
jgi:hypothetical protein